MNDYYDYVAPDYIFRFGIGGDWFFFRDKNFGITGDIKNGDWKLKIYDIRPGHECVINHLVLDDLPYETLVSFRKALGIKSLGWVLDRKVTLLEEEK